MNDAATSPAAAAQHAPRRPAAWAAALAAAAAAAVITGCSATPSPSAASNPASAASTSPAAAPSSGPASTPAASTSAVATPTTPPTPAPPTPSATAAGPAPVLGQLAGVFAQGQGFGQAEPSKIFNGGDPTGLVTKLTWSSWGGSQAVGSGVSDYVGPGQSVATGKQKPVTVVAFKLGTCHGTLMYKAVEWYFPKEGQAFSPGQYENICSGRYVPGS
jgi:hypothetical protein